MKTDLDLALRKGADETFGRRMCKGLHRGGRMTKYKKQVASFAPALAHVLPSASVVAMGATLSLGGGAAQAGSCTASQLLSPHLFTCSGPAAPRSDTTATLNASGVTANTTAGFGIDVSSGVAIQITNTGGALKFTDNHGSSITSTGANFDGLTGYNQGVGTDNLSIKTTGTVTGGRRGISVFNEGSGSATVSAKDVTGTNGEGVRAVNFGTDLLVTTTGTVEGDSSGIYGENQGSGSTTVSVKDATGTRYYGIDILNFASSTDASVISTGTVTGAHHGIRNINRGSGSTTVSAMDVTGTSGDGVYAFNSASGTDISVTTTGTVRGGTSGIAANNSGSGTTLVRVSGAVTGGTTGAGIWTRTNAGQLTTIDLLDGASVSATSGDAIVNNEGDSRVSFYRGSSVSGAVRLGDGEDHLWVQGGADISAATLFDGGDGTLDEVAFSGFSGAVDGSLFANWETLAVDNSSDLTLNGNLTGVDAVAIRNNSSVTTGSADFRFGGDLQVGSTGRFFAGSGGLAKVVLDGSVLNDGLISLADGRSGDRLTFGSTLSGNGAIGLDVDFAAGMNDTVLVTGDSAGARQGLRIDKSGSGNGAERDFTLVTVSGASTASDFRLVNADFVTRDGQQALSDGDVVYTLNYDAASGRFVLSPFDNSGGVTNNPGGELLASAVQQFSDHLALGGTLVRVTGNRRGGAAEINTVSRSLSELTTTDRPVVWVQAEGGRDRYTTGNREVETTSGGLRFGASLPLAEVGNGYVIGGLEFGAAALSTTESTPLMEGKVDTDAFDVTLSGLWVTDSQLYLDGQLRYAYFDGTSRPEGGAEVDTDGRGYAASLEIGKPFALQSGVNLIPQAQVMYSRIEQDSFADPTGGGLSGSVADGTMVTGRLGLRAEYELVSRGVLFGQVDYYHAFNDQTGVTFGQNTVLTERGRNTAALTLGGNVALTDRTVLYGEVSGETGIGSSSSDYAIAGQIGVELKF